MLGNIAKGLLQPNDEVDQEVVRVDQNWGFAEFPYPGDVKRHTLPVFVDPEEENIKYDEVVHDDDIAIDFREHWMPDRLCKVCYCCEDAFTMFRRRHHCRLCGQIFCNQCSSYYMDGALINMTGLVRCCKLCHDQMMERIERESKAKKYLERYGEIAETPKAIEYVPEHKSASDMIEDPHARLYHINLLQNRASKHLDAIVGVLVKGLFPDLEKNELWRITILNLVREVVASVDPNVRQGDSMDIRNYVKLKVIPGGSMSENVFIDGVVFRKNVAHKKMMHDSQKLNPKILLLSGAIDFQRLDAKLSSMDTLIEQEDKYMEILVEKIMSLKPDIVLVGKSVARKAQELFCNYNVVVMQNVKLQLLERLSRMTGATIITSTDHMFQQFGQQCLGTCGNFYLRHIHDDPDKAGQLKSTRILQNRIARGSTYVYFCGCPQEKGCTITLRGDCRDVLSRIKRILSFAVIVAYHLRLEVAFFADRCSTLMLPDEEFVDYESEDELFAGDEEDTPQQQTSHTPGCIEDIKSLSNRALLSTSLDVDFRFPFKEEIFGLNHRTNVNIINKKLSPEEHQTLLVTSILMYESMQRSKPEVKGIRYYTIHDLPLGQFLVENCFGLHRRDSSMLDQTLSFIHRPGRLDISVTRLGEFIPSTLDESHVIKNPLTLPIYMYSYCKICKRIVTPEVTMSDESWKMSFGKYMEMFFYNRRAKCRTGYCNHFVRDDHIVVFTCDNVIAKFNFVPIHSYSLYIRKNLDFPYNFHIDRSLQMLSVIPVEFSKLIETFKLAISKLVVEAKAVLFGRVDDLQAIVAELASMEMEFQSSSLSIVDNIANTINNIPKKIFNDSAFENSASSRRSSKHLISSQASNTTSIISNESMSNTSNEGDVIMYQSLDPKIRYPMIHKRDVFLCAASWNSRIDAIVKHLESVKEMLIQQQQQAPGSAMLQHPNFIGGSTMNNTFLSANSSAIQSNNKAFVATEEIDDDDIVVGSVERRGHIYGGDTLDIPTENLGLFGDVDQPGEENLSDKRTVTFDVTSSSMANSNNNNDSSNREINNRNQGKQTNRITKALQRLVLGREIEAETKFEVDLSILGAARPTLPIGRRAEVIGVIDDEPGTIIAYSLASNEYYQALNNFLREDYDEQLSDDEKGDIIDGDIPTEAVLVDGSSPKNATSSKNKEKDNDENDYFDQDQAPEISANALKNKTQVSMAFSKVASMRDLQDQSGYSNNMFGKENGTNSINNGNLDNNDNANIIDNNNGSDVETDVGENDDDNDYDSVTADNVNQRNEFVRMQIIEKQLLSQRKSHFKHRFEDKDMNGNVLCKFQCHTFWATQFEALRQAYFKSEDNEQFIQSLALSNRWLAQGGKSGASFSKTSDDRFVIKVINRVEMQMFLEFAPAYFEYMAKAFFHSLPTLLCKIVGVYTIGYHNRETGKKVLENVVVMENIFYQRNITRTFDLKGSSRARYLEVIGTKPDPFDDAILKRRKARRAQSAPPRPVETKQVLLDDNLMELTSGRPIPLKHRAKIYFSKAVTNDTLFLSMVDVVDYSILVGFDEDTNSIVVGIIDYMRKYDIIKKMERMGKSVGMLTGQAEPTIIQPPQYRKRFSAAMDKYFMTVPDKWMAHDV